SVWSTAHRSCIAVTCTWPRAILRIGPRRVRMWSCALVRSELGHEELPTRADCNAKPTFSLLSKRALMRSAKLVCGCSFILVVSPLVLTGSGAGEATGFTNEDHARTVLTSSQ